MCGASKLGGTRRIRMNPEFTGISLISSLIRGSMQSRIMFSNLSLSSSAETLVIGLMSFGRPFRSPSLDVSTPIIKSPPEALASEETSARNLSRGSLPEPGGIDLYSKVPDSATSLSIKLRMSSTVISSSFLGITRYSPLEGIIGYQQISAIFAFLREDSWSEPRTGSGTSLGPLPARGVVKWLCRLCLCLL